MYLSCLFLLPPFFHKGGRCQRLYCIEIATVIFLVLLVPGRYFQNLTSPILRGQVCFPFLEIGWAFVTTPVKSIKEEVILPDF